MQTLVHTVALGFFFVAHLCRTFTIESSTDKIDEFILTILTIFSVYFLENSIDFPQNLRILIGGGLRKEKSM